MFLFEIYNKPIKFFSPPHFFGLRKSQSTRPEKLGGQGVGRRFVGLLINSKIPKVKTFGIRTS
ncbi:MAG: hypothetical protein A3B96_01375 [Candidatus Spechtbacteria bacterium RIFCSPHIGHO2_02_FULL_43_15b]|uniref:Uncharacterized protein n=1 Tax=Candidatus Spechtbacteria bacterium RIFCSPHIGHO2_01_FULL_43_30 TaxID=1802158 RepID=A0A1G2H6I8_9BACT|nr:MAG: hypothetical protein A2827_00295 [Candidatus Spechtbacteria bacterium RIFCSPHIGHO2_01_FULL_43_30]OGZ59061.1 MAG: hypothetical protein A3B96_01375 [Candidatus Spechtbacteria bacterium RIFCSPHIGHO2_02_FULL_43_15b]